MSISINGYIDYFKKSIKSKEMESLGRGNIPLFPILMFYFGSDAEQDAKWVLENLLMVWPQCKENLLSFCIPDSEKNEYFHLSPDGKTNKVEFREIQTMVGNLFDRNSPFFELDAMQVYFCLDTTSVESEDEVQKWFDLSGDMLSRISRRKKAYFMMLLNQDLAHEEKRIPYKILNSFEHYDFKGIDDIFILSNSLSSGVLLKDMSDCCRIYSDIIMLTNDSQNRISLEKGIYTVGYAFQAKPLEQIAKVVVNTVINKCEAFRSERITSDLFTDELPGRLGFSDRGVSQLLSTYIDKSVKLPTEEQLSLFPRANDTDVISADLTTEQLDSITLGAWSAFLSMIERKLEADPALIKKWYNKYKKVLTDSFSSDEILILADNIDRLAGFFSSIQKPLRSEKAFSYAKKQMAYSLCSNQTIIDLFISVINDMAKEAETMKAVWNRLFNSRYTISDDSDDNIKGFYQRKVSLFFDQNSEEKRKNFAKIHSEREFENYFHSILNDIISSDDIYTKSFYEELEKRLTNGNNPIESRTYIRNKLNQGSTVAYLNTIGSLDDPVLSSILLKTNTAIHESLKEHFPYYHYYNTGNDDRAESVLLYRLDVERHLLR